MTRVRGEGPRTAKIIVVAEAPGEREVAMGRPLIGPSGFKLESWWHGVGLHRGQLRLENVCEIRPPNNKIESLGKAELAKWAEDLRQRLRELYDPWLIVPLGNTALWALTGHEGITKWRGSLLEWHDGERKIKVIPSLHPEGMLRQPYWEKRCRNDWAKIVRESGTRHVKLPTRVYTTDPTVEEFEGYIERVLGHGKPITLDIETPGGTIGCVGFSDSATGSLTVPTVASYWGASAMPRVWDGVRELCEGPNEKILQNGFFDSYYLHFQCGITLNNYKWDLLAMHHCLDAADDHDLAYMASVDLDGHVYWKDTAKDPESNKRFASNSEALWTYNGMDCCNQFALWEVYYSRLRERGKLDFYAQHYTALFTPLFNIMTTGIRVDTRMRKRLAMRLMGDLYKIEQDIQIVAGTKLHAAKAISSKKVIEYAKGLHIKVPVKRRMTGDKTESMDAITIHRLNGKYAKFKPVGKLVLEHRKVSELIKYTQEKRYDADDRMRSSYKFTTETGRLASSKNPMGTGSNAQNVARAVREMFLADVGCVLLEVDLSQAESRVVDMLTGDEKCIERARAKPSEVDAHRENAARIFGIEAQDVTKVQRYLGKKAKHASNYGMRGEKLSDELLKEGYVVAPAECQRMIDKALEQPILDWQREVRATMLRHRKLVNSWGRELSFEFARLDDEDYRQGYAFFGQSEVICHINQLGFIPLVEWLVKYKNKLKTTINLHCHDALILSCPPNEVWFVAQFLSDKLTAPRTLAGHEYNMWCEFKVGLNWGKMHEWKELPSREEMESVARELLASV